MTLAHRLAAVVASVAAFVMLVYVLGQRDRPGDIEIAAPAPISANVQEAEAPAPSSTEFPTAELHSALTKVCSENDSESADEEMAQKEIQAKIDSFNELKASLSDILSVSALAEHLHLAALLESDSDARVDLLGKAILNSPSDPSIVWSAVRVCSESAVTLGCPLSDWEQRLIAVDGQNSESWIRIAANRHAAGDTDAALEAMQHAATAAETRIYWPETVEIFERGLAAAGSEYPFPERAGMAFGFAAVMLPRYGDYTKMCVDQASQSAEWAYTCLRYGELAENQSKTEIGVSIGRSMQKLALEALGEIEKAAEIERRLERRRSERLSADIEHTKLIERLMVSNPTMFSSYLAATRSVGEVAARRQITAGIERLLEQQPELACEP